MASKIQNITLEGVRIGFRNFSGKEGKFNAAGDRNFVIFLNPETATDLERLGWSVKYLKAREEDDEEQAFLKVKIKYSAKARPPRAVMVTSRGRNPLDEDTIEIFDWVDIENVDVIVRPFEWEVGGKTGVSAYLQSIYVTIREDELERKYADVPMDSAQKALPSGNSSDVFEGDFEDLGETPQFHRRELESGF